MNRYNEQVKEYVKKNYKGKSTIELTNEINELFNLCATTDNIQNLKSRIKRTGFVFEPAKNDGYIKKGNIPANKGKKWDDYLSKEKQENCRKTTFKKGNIPKNHREVGSERLSKDGYIEIKVEEPNKWKYKHRLIYEKYYGKIPKGYNVIFLDGNKLNIDIKNLKAISKHDNLIMNEKKLRYKNKELTESAYLIAKIENKNRKLKNERL